MKKRVTAGIEKAQEGMQVVKSGVVRHRGKLIAAGALLAMLLAAAAIKQRRSEEKPIQVVIEARKRANDVFTRNGITYESKDQKKRLLNWGAAATGGIGVLKEFLRGDEVQTSLFVSLLNFVPFLNSIAELVRTTPDEVRSAFPEKGRQVIID